MQNDDTGRNHAEDALHGGDPLHYLSEESLREQLSRRGFLVAGMGAAAGIALAACGGGSSSSSSGAGVTSSGATPSGGTPKRGGRLTIAYIGAGSSDSLNPTQACLNDITIARAASIYDGLVSYPDANGDIHPMLAESLEPNKDGTVWDIRLRSGVTWHDGSALNADDVIYWLNYIANPKTGACLSFLPSLFLDLKGMKKLDNLTVRLPLKLPMANLPAMFCQEGQALIKRGTTSFSKPVGTGPFEFVSWTPGQNTVMKRNANYWQNGLPYLDELEFVSIPDTTARINALLAGQVDGASGLPYAQAKAYLAQGSSSPINVLVTNGNNEVYFTLGTAHKPFSDVRVRQAFKYMINREEMLKTVNLGFGQVLNDLWGKGQTHYDSSIPQRPYDPEKAKALLKQAGAENANVTITTAPFVPGQVEAATVFAQQAQAAGVTINVRKVPASTYFSQGWPNYPFGQTSFQAAPLDYFYATTQLPGCPYPDTQWADPKATKLVEDALGDLNPATAQDKWNAWQQYDWDNGAQIHWATGPYTDGLSKKVHGAVPVQSSFFDFGGSIFTKYWLE
jgi:peptide/nickel transport system substrate-binding protein